MGDRGLAGQAAKLNSIEPFAWMQDGSAGRYRARAAGFAPHPGGMDQHAQPSPGPRGVNRHDDSDFDRARNEAGCEIAGSPNGSHPPRSTGTGSAWRSSADRAEPPTHSADH